MDNSSSSSDPLINESILVEGISVGAVCERQRIFQNDYSQYIQLIKSSYFSMAHRDPELTKRISLSMYQYYCVVLLWKRLFYVLTEGGKKGDEYNEFVRRLAPCALVIPSEIDLYLKGIGNLVDYQKINYHLNLQAKLSSNTVQDISGHFGRVDDITHIYYETLPSPFVAVYRILKDLEYTMADGAKIVFDPVWNLPEELTPEGNLIINRNLLGWDLAQKLTSDQCYVMHKKLYVTFNNDKKPVYHVDGIDNFNGFPIFPKMLWTITTELENAARVPHISNQENTSLNGSVAQKPFQVRTHGSRAIGLHLPPIYELESTTYSYSQTSEHISGAATIFRYRVKRVVNGYHDSLCYTDQHGNAPKDWDKKADSIFHSISFWNISNFHVTEVSGRCVNDRFVEKVQKNGPNSA